MKFEVGTVLRRHGQRYDVAGFRPHVCRKVELLSRCIECGDWYAATATKKSIRSGYLTRTCLQHRGLARRWRRPVAPIDAVLTAGRPREFLSARDLAALFGRSPAVVRNALGRLFKGKHARRDNVATSHGLLVLRRRRGNHAHVYLVHPPGSRRDYAVEQAAFIAARAAAALEARKPPARRLEPPAARFAVEPDDIGARLAAWGL
jgi:hypothetical protein